MKLIAVAVLIFLAGCSTGPGFQDTPYAQQPAPPDRARIIFFRQGDRNPGGKWARLEIDGIAAGKLGRGRFLVVDVAPGERRIAVDEDEKKARFAVMINAEAGQIHYLQVARAEGHKKIEASGLFAVVVDLIAPLFSDDKAPFDLEPIHSGLALQRLKDLEAAE